MKLKNTVISNKRFYLYQRRYPKRLQSHPQIKTAIYRKSMGVTTSSSHEEILAAHKYAHAAYEDFIKVLSLANTDLLDQAEMIRLADSIVANNSLLKAGMLHRDPMLSQEQWDAAFEESMNNLEASEAVNSILYKHREQAAKGDPLAPMTTEQTIESLVAQIVSEPAGPKGRSSVPLLSQCWDTYREAKSIDLGTNDGRNKLRVWTQLLELVGDTVMVADRLQAAIDTYVEKLCATGIKGTTVDTRVRKNLAIIRYTIDQRRLGIVLVKPKIKGATDFADDYVLTAQEERALMTALGAMEPSWKTAALAVILETGCLTSELQRLEQFNVHLDEPVPHLILKNEKMKTNARARVLTPVCPTTLRLLRNQMFTREWGQYQKMTSTAVTEALKKILKKIAPQATPRSLRHGVKNRMLSAGIPLDVQYLIGGWSNGLNTIALGYGRGAVTSEQTLLTLQAALKTANGSMEPQGPSNVIQLREGP